MELIGFRYKYMGYFISENLYDNHIDILTEDNCLIESINIPNDKKYDSSYKLKLITDYIGM